MYRFVIAFCLLLVASNAQADVQHYYGEGDAFDFGMEVNGRAATLLLADKNTNAPIEDAVIVFVPAGDGNEIEFLGGTDGKYIAFLKEEGEPTGELRVEVKGQKDVLPIDHEGHDADAHDQEGHDEGHHEEGQDGHDEGEHAHEEGDDHHHGFFGELEHIVKDHGLFVGLGFGGLLFVGGWWIGRRQTRGSAALAVLVAAGFVASDEGFAGGNHVHAEVGVDDGGEGTTVKVSKRAQFLIGLRTVPAEIVEAAGVFRTFGHIIAKPQLDAHVRAPRDGELRDVDENIWGKKVKRGEVLARIEAVGLIPVRSPISGTVIRATGVSGMRVAAGDDLLRVVDTTKLWVDAEVFQKDLDKVKKASSVYVNLETGAGLVTREARLVGAQTVVDENTMTGKIFLEIDNEDGRFSIGNTVQVMFQMSDAAARGVLLPYSAVLYRGAETIVYIKTGPQTFDPRPVAHQPGPEPGTVLVTAGLSPGDRVVTVGNYQLLVGAK